MGYGYRWAPYVSVAQRRAQAKRHVAKLAKKGREILPVEITGRKIATTFWGKAWCENLESYSDFANRLPRGRTYVRNGSVVDLQIESGKISAIVSGSEIYEVNISIDKLKGSLWEQIKHDCSQSIDSLMDLLQGRFSDGVMQRLTRQKDGLFPSPKEIKIRCSCPDYAYLCKHAAATLYGVGARLDTDPEMLFLLRDVDHLDLIGEAVEGSNLDEALSGETESTLQGEDLGDLFGIDLGGSDAVAAATTTRKKAKRSSKKKAASPKATAARKTTRSKSAKKSATGSVSSGKATVKKKAVKKKAAKKKAVAKNTVSQTASNKVAKKAVKKKATKKKAAAKARPAKKSK